MSHFVVIVVGDNIEQQLAPYQENNMGDCPPEYLSFQDNTEEVMEGWENDKNDDGVSVQEEFESLEAYAKEYYGYDPHDDDPIKFGCMRNDNAKWDWYQVGGRWSGYFPLKPGATGEMGETSWATGEVNAQTADSVRLQDIDVERARDEAETQARERFAVWREAFETHGRPVGWDETLERLEDNIEQARKEYWEQPAIAALRETRALGFSIKPVRDLGFDEEAYVQKQRDDALVSFAVLKDGKWHERGQMGWWATVSNEKDPNEWNREFQNLLNDLPPNTLLTAVDCHI